jgi:hypothetical protein
MQTGISDKSFEDRILTYLRQCIVESLALEDIAHGYSGSTLQSPHGNVNEAIAHHLHPSCRPIPSLPSTEDCNALSRDVKELAHAVQIHKCRYACFRGADPSKPYLPCRMRFPRKLNDIAKIDLSDGTFVNRRTSNHVNNFNPRILAGVRANMDIKTVLLGPKGLVYYCTDHTTKSQMKTHPAFTLIHGALNSVKQSLGNIASQDASRLLIIRCLNALASQQ